jgi:hypothetical protein
MFVLGNSTTKISLGNRCKPNFLSRSNLGQIATLTDRIAGAFNARIA